MSVASSSVSRQDPTLKLCLVQSICMISQAISSSTQAASFHFSRKAELITQIMVRLDILNAKIGVGQLWDPWSQSKG